MKRHDDGPSLIYLLLWVIAVIGFIAVMMWRMS